MKRVIVISDSHGSLSNVRKIIQKHERIDMMIHLGDIMGQDEELQQLCECPLIVVSGNCDYYSKNPWDEIITLGNHKIFATHGHHYGVHYGLDGLYHAALERECDIALYGHTHVPDIDYRGTVTLMNPGSITQPRQLNRKPTYLMLEIEDNGEIKNGIYYA